MSKAVVKGIVLLPSVGDGSYGAKARLILAESVGGTDRIALTRLREDLTAAVKDIDYLLGHCEPDGRCKDRDITP